MSSGSYNLIICTRNSVLRSIIIKSFTSTYTCEQKKNCGEVGFEATCKCVLKRNQFNKTGKPAVLVRGRGTLYIDFTGRLS